MSEISIGSRVELIPGRENVYRLAVAGSRGWIRDQREDDYGYDQVYIEWDKDYWKYNGEPDGWSFASHFRELDSDESASLYFEQMKTREDAELCSNCGEPHEQGAALEGYLESLEKGVADALKADGFLMISVSADLDPQTGDVVFTPRLFGACLNEVATALLEAQIVQLASMSFREHALDLLEEINEEDHDEDES